MYTYRIILPKSSGFSFGFEQRENVTFTDRSLDVPDDLTVLFADELDLDLGTLALGTGTSQNFEHARQHYWFVHFVVLQKKKFKLKIVPRTGSTGIGGTYSWVNGCRRVEAKWPE